MSICPEQEERMPQEQPWPVILGAAIGVQAQLEEFDEEGLLKSTLPNLKAAEEQVVAFEATLGERLPENYRDFLLHADGWMSCFSVMDLFGLAELKGSGRWNHAQELLRSYEAEEVLEESEVVREQLLPVGAGQGNDLIVLIRNGYPDAGTVIWFDGGEDARFDDFGDFVENFIVMQQDYMAHLRSQDTSTGLVLLVRR
jgi:hypothetical protein